MARQEATNIFSDALMSDLHPINTPKSVLTDCLNGTYITYNGNEFLLQNDMGNYKLKNCRLPVNFIPVGVKSYADILYIVSYNPITKEVEVGSYPAPQSIFTTEDTPNKVADENDLAPFGINGTVQYPDIIKQDKKPLFVFTKSDEENYKLNPGDEFKITGLTDETVNFIYQHLNFYILDEDKKLYDIDDSELYLLENLDSEEQKKYLTDDGFRKVFWETPGWLAAQYDLYVPDSFNLNLRTLTVPEFMVQKEETTETQAEEEENLTTIEPSGNQFKVSMDLSAQVVVSDLLFQNQLMEENDPKCYNNENNEFIHFKIRFLIKTGENYGSFQGIHSGGDITEWKTYKDTEYYYIDIPCKKHNYQDNIITAYVNALPVWFFPGLKEGESASSYPGKVEIKAYPIIDYNTQVLEYTQFETVYQFDLNNLKDKSDIKIGESIYKWAVDDDSCTISFDVDGPFINTSNITGRYEIYRLNYFNYTQERTPETIPEPTQPTSWSWWDMRNSELIQNTKYFGTLNVDADKFEESEFQQGDATLSNGYNLLMCEGTIPNLVLFGQNTINIEWTSSNIITLPDYLNFYTVEEELTASKNINSRAEIVGPPIQQATRYKVVQNPRYDGTTTKNVSFEKEGGIYLFRIILEQDGQEFAWFTKKLIPSEVFNDWFGSVDNFETITGTSWINQYIEKLKINSLNINKLDFNFANEAQTADKLIQYHWSNSNTWNILNKEEVIKLVKASDLSIKDNVDTINNWTYDVLLVTIIALEYPDLVQFKIEQGQLIYNWITSTSPQTTKNLYLRFDYMALQPIIDSDIVFNVDYLNGNLWNPIIDTTVELKQNNDTVLTLSGTETELEVNAEGLYEDYVVTPTLNTEYLPMITTFFPFYEALKNRAYLEIFTYLPSSPGYFHLQSKNKFWGDLAWQISTMDSNANSLGDNRNKHINSNSIKWDEQRGHYNEMGWTWDKNTSSFQSIIGSTTSSLGILHGIYYNLAMEVNQAGAKLGIALGAGPAGENGNLDDVNIFNDHSITNKGNYKSNYSFLNYITLPTIGNPAGTNTYCITLKIDNSTLLALSRVKINESNDSRLNYFLQWDFSQLNLPLQYNIGINKYQSVADIYMLRNDDKIWNVQENEELLLDIDFINTQIIQNGSITPMTINLDLETNDFYRTSINQVISINSLSDWQSILQKAESPEIITVCTSADDPDIPDGFFIDAQGSNAVQFTKYTMNEIINATGAWTPDTIKEFFESHFSSEPNLKWKPGVLYYNNDMESWGKELKIQLQLGKSEDLSSQSYTYYGDITNS